MNKSKTDIERTHKDLNGQEYLSAWVTAEFAQELEDELETAKYFLRQIIGSLPRNKDWLDPDVERGVKFLLDPPADKR